MWRKSRWFVLAVMAVTGVWVVAQPPGDGAEGKKGGPGGMLPPHPLMETLDIDKDGKLSAEEIKKSPQSLMKLDKNGDGELSREELRPSRPDMGKGMGKGGKGGPEGKGSKGGKGGPEGKGSKGGPGQQGKGGAPEGKESGPARPPLEKPDPQSQSQLQVSPSPLPEAIAWYTDLDAGLAEAKRTNKPILLMSAAPSCSGVSGVW